MASRREILVVGLGRFGTALAETLMTLGHDVMAVDADHARVQAAAPSIGHVVQADATDLEAMRQLGAGDFGTAVVAIGAEVEASVLAASVMLDLGVPRVWGKAITVRHGRILERLGVHRVVFPEGDMGERVAHALTGRTIDFISLDQNFVVAETTVPASVAGRRLRDAGIRSRHGVTVVAVKPEGGEFAPATGDTLVQADDLLLVVGVTAKVERFCRIE